MTLSIENYEEFKKEFWVWFDSLPSSQKQKFHEYPEDIAETNFYFTVWSKRNSTDA